MTQSMQVRGRRCAKKKRKEHRPRKSAAFSARNGKSCVFFWEKREETKKEVKIWEVEAITKGWKTGKPSCTCGNETDGPPMGSLLLVAQRSEKEPHWGAAVPGKVPMYSIIQKWTRCIAPNQLFFSRNVEKQETPFPGTIPGTGFLVLMYGKGVEKVQCAISVEEAGRR